MFGHKICKYPLSTFNVLSFVGPQAVGPRPSPPLRRPLGPLGQLVVNGMFLAIVAESSPVYSICTPLAFSFCALCHFLASDFFLLYGPHK